METKVLGIWMSRVFFCWKISRPCLAPSRSGLAKLRFSHFSSAECFLKFGEIRNSARRKIRYEEKSSISVDRFVFNHHPDNVYHLSTETNESLALWFAFRYLSSEICSCFFVAHAWYLRECHSVKSTVQSSVATSWFNMTSFLATGAFSWRTTGVFRQRSGRSEPIDVSNFSDDSGGENHTATGNSLNGVVVFQKFCHIFFKISDFVMNIQKSSDFSFHGLEEIRIAFWFSISPKS